MECPICSSPFGTDGCFQPRMLKCGHTFCTDCILDMSQQKSIKCPYCSTITSIEIMGGYALPVNLTLIKVIHDLKTQKDETKVQDLCCACSKEKAIKICFNCDPVGCKLCETCCRAEHGRRFAPVRAHKPILIKDVKRKPRNECRRHRGRPLTHYSEKTGTFACRKCLDNQPEYIKADYVQVEAAIQTLKSRVTVAMENLQGYLKRLEDSQQTISTMQSQLLEIGPEIIEDIQKQFADFQVILQKRQNTLLKNVDTYLTARKERSESQLFDLQEITTELISQKEQLSSFMEKEGKEFLTQYQDIFSYSCALLNAEDPALQRPACKAEISIYIPDNFIKNLNAVGTVGGGPDVIDFKAQMFRGLLQLKWNVRHKENKIKEYEIEYQLVPVSCNSEGPSSVICNGKTFQHYMDCLCPGYTYTFRMRSSIFSGWGMWTKPLTAKYSDFPCTISYIGKVVQIKAPITGSYQVTAKGAKAADGKCHKGGRGAIISAVFTLQEEDVLDILCGGMSVCQGCHSGGGGGTFVSVNTREFKGILVVAGGGGGTRGYDSKDTDGCDASLEPHGTAANAEFCAEGGRDGAPGNDAMFPGPPWGYGGAGWQQSSTTAKSFVDGGKGGECGGFGGGGGVGIYGGGGGGGFSGGGGGRGGGGGGSYVRSDGESVTKEVGNMGHGEVKIVRLAISNNSSDTDVLLSDLSSANSTSSNSKECTSLSPNNSSLANSTSSNSKECASLSPKNTSVSYSSNEFS